MKIGYDNLGEAPFYFTIEDPEQQMDVSFLKLFLPNTDRDLHGIEQCGLKELSNRDMERFDESVYEPICDTFTITIVQRRKK